jgi:hypothetical protein
MTKKQELQKRIMAKVRRMSHSDLFYVNQVVDYLIIKMKKKKKK